MDVVKRLLPELSTALRKGNCGRLGVIGGSMEYTGAPYFAAISALKVGADLVHVFTAADAAPVVKSYSPELIVHPELEPGHWLQRMDALIVGPGLGREERSLQIARESIAEAQRLGIPLIIDADGLWAFTEHWISLTSPSLHRAELPIILTPNAVEMDRLAQKVLQLQTLGKSWEEIRYAVSRLADRLKMNIFVKGPTDMFATTDGKVRLFDREGSPRRPGGIGDCLSGVLACFLLWSTRSGGDIEKVGEAGSCFVRECARRAYEEIGRGMVAGDVIGQVAPLVKHIDKAIEKPSAV
ncbi:hypothetical protein PENTCL1PPCAC_10488 [Pristionchus entomophagus]|uniref:ATP-dependent (S)-NAD(P)H-hydrate dehydratase n=1 Tax=Pristionchus entomophagus TaxID=358040 RepID=A0AAV5T296_9BILA|nr:hypothetical protein PENTCL1PPCAC_10488 [Pristionchus entomophagus]